MRKCIWGRCVLLTTLLTAIAVYTDLSSFFPLKEADDKDFDFIERQVKQTEEVQQKVPHVEISASKKSVDTRPDPYEEIFTSRNHHLRQYCNQIGEKILSLNVGRDLQDALSHPGNLDTLRWNDRYRFIISIVHKIGSTNWMKLLRELDKRGGKRKPPIPLEFKYWDPVSSMSKLPPSELRFRIEKYTKILFVRHPFVRLLSAYRDKFVEHNSKTLNNVKLISEILPLSGVNNSQKSIVTFVNFVQYVLSPNGSSNSHWTPIYQRSRPCKYRYDFIGRMETIDTDISFLLKHLKISHIVKYGAGNSTHTTTSKPEFLHSFFKGVPQEEFDKLTNLYRHDFRAFNYSVPKTANDLLEIPDSFYP